jgi:gas vesicle protein
MRESDNLGSTISALAIGIAIGAALGVLFAPSSGEQTRDYLLESAREGLDNAVSQGRRWTGQARKVATQAKQKLNDAAGAGVKAFDEAREA